MPTYMCVMNINILASDCSTLLTQQLLKWLKVLNVMNMRGPMVIKMSTQLHDAALDPSESATADRVTGNRPFQQNSYSR